MMTSCCMGDDPVAGADGNGREIAEVHHVEEAVEDGEGATVAFHVTWVIT